VKAGKTPGAWEKNPAKNRQKDKDARWTKKHGKSFYGYKNHVDALPLQAAASRSSVTSRRML
jgi:hypothetical protein